MFNTQQELTSLDQVGRGFIWNWKRIQDEKFWENLYYRRYDELFDGPPTIDNGYSIVDRDNIIGISIFSSISQFYWDSILGERPTITSTAEDRQTWLDENLETIFHALDKAVEYWSYKGRAILLVTEDNQVMPIDSSFYFPIKDPMNRDKTIAHLLAYLWYQQEPNSVFNKNPGMDNRITLIKFDPATGTATRDTHEMHGNTIGPLLESLPADTKAINVMGDGNSFYPAIVPPARNIMIRFSALNRVLNKHTSPHLVKPTQFEFDPTTGKPKKLNPNGDVIIEPGTANSQEMYYLVWDGNLESSYDFIDKMQDYIHLTTGVPPVVFGIDVGKGESGASRDRLMFSAMAKVRRDRREIETLIKDTIMALDAPEGDLQFSWVTDPFADYYTKIQAVISLQEAGITTQDESREDIGRDALEEGGEVSGQDTGIPEETNTNSNTG